MTIISETFDGPHCPRSKINRALKENHAPVFYKISSA